METEETLILMEQTSQDLLLEQREELRVAEQTSGEWEGRQHQALEIQNTQEEMEVQTFWLTSVLAEEVAQEVLKEMEL
jgi:hypothetical protein